jgi:hypothetical protein
MVVKSVSVTWGCNFRHPHLSVCNHSCPFFAIVDPIPDMDPTECFNVLPVMPISSRVAYPCLTLYNGFLHSFHVTYKVIYVFPTGSFVHYKFQISYYWHVWFEKCFPKLVWKNVFWNNFRLYVPKKFRWNKSILHKNVTKLRDPVYVTYKSIVLTKILLVTWMRLSITHKFIHK